LARKQTIQSEGPPSEWASLSPTNWKWLDDLCLLIQGKEGRQNFINTLTDTKPNNSNIKTFFVNDGQADAYFTENDGQVDPYIGPEGELVVPTTIVATKRQIVNVGALRAYQTAGQTIFSGTPSIVIFGTTSFDEDDGYNSGAGSYTPLQAGKYLVTGSVGYDICVANSTVSIGIAKNGITVAGVQVHTSTIDPVVVQVTDLVEIDGDTDYLQIATQQNFGVNTDTSGTAFTCYFTAFKVD